VRIHRLVPVLTILAAFAVLSHAQPAASPAPSAKKSSTKAIASGARSRPASGSPSAQTDVQIEKAIRERFADSKIAEEKFEVHVQGGRATLTGKTNVLQHKGVATRLARAQGATEVINNIEPSEEARQKAAANLTKGRRRAQVKRGDARSEQ
jgi:osmotically-inducible protein OsmY